MTILLEGLYPTSINSKFTPPLWGRLSLLKYTTPDKLEIVDLTDVKKHNPEPEDPEYSSHSFRAWWDRDDSKDDMKGRTVFHV
jgi:hypothetical protein